jgi:Holliday junction resolvase-like predicted endonuclease
MAAVNRGKRRAFGRAVVRYLRQLRQRPTRVRFDVVEVVGQPGDATPVIRHIANAFSLPPEYRLPE